MYNILTCDDEQIAIDSLRFIFEKNFEGQINVFSALSGTEALQIVNKEKIDIIFMDINMPGMTGLETISCILNLKPDTIIIVLSAFDKFQYAQEAMNLGAFKYITKPVNRNVVIQTVRSAMNLVDEKRGQLLDSMKIQKKLDSVSPMVESDFIYSCIFNIKNEDLTPYLEYFNIENLGYFFCCLEIPKSETGKKDILQKIRKVVNEHATCLTGSLMVNRLVLFIPISQTESQQAEIVSHSIARDIFTILNVHVCRGIRAGVSRVCQSSEDFTECYNQALSNLNNTDARGGILFPDDKSEKVTSSEGTEELSKRLLTRLKIGDAAGVQHLTDNYCTALLESNFPLDKVRFNILEILINSKNITKESCPSFETVHFEDAFQVLSNASDVEEMKMYMQRLLFECTRAISESKPQKENPVIKKVCAYINLHLSEDFSLEDVASEVNVSKFYLSKLFKEEMNETFINYLTEMRLEKSAKLLKETDFSVKEISAMCGYNDQNYFSKLFKNKFSVSPTEYR